MTLKTFYHASERLAMSTQCPSCGLECAESALQCDCGHHFVSSQSRTSYLCSSDEGVAGEEPVTTAESGVNSRGGTYPEPLPPGESSPQSLRQPDRRANYLVRHWRGDLPLHVSYWINGVLTNVVAMAVLIVPIILTHIDINYGGALGWGAFWATLILLNLWQVVGIWRSAARHIK